MFSFFSIYKVKTIKDLGVIECFTVLIYRLLLKFSIHPICYVKSEIPEGPFFEASRLARSDFPSISTWEMFANLFGHINIPIVDEAPNWLSNPINNKVAIDALRPWWKISDFDETVGDIKLIWEQSRMNWAVAFAQRARNGDHRALNRLNFWLSDWLENNPPYLGPNWKCGQEASIRVINLCVAALILGQERCALPGLQKLIILHLRRIAPTISYAIAQNNNHGTSEAAALFIGGSWLVACSTPDGSKYEAIGRKWLNNRANKLIEEDGSFSQYSLNYHRMALDTFSITELWRRRVGLNRFSLAYYDRIERATLWLYQMICPISGDGPNVGANDGSHLIQLTNSAYRDFRPSVQLASNLFGDFCAYPKVGNWNLHLAWLGLVEKKFTSSKYENCNFDHGGYKLLRSGSADLLLRYPRFRFRPSQADALHVDLRVDGVDVLSDAGTFSYNTSSDLSEYFNGTASHNTVQFDDRDQMPRLGRFLFGSWLKTESQTPIFAIKNQVSCSASYVDYKGARHKRSLFLDENKLIVLDDVSGFKKKAVIRWRLTSVLSGFKILHNGVKITQGNKEILVTSDSGIMRTDICIGWESKCYSSKVEIQVLECEIESDGTFRTEIRWH